MLHELIVENISRRPKTDDIASSKLAYPQFWLMDKPGSAVYVWNNDF